MKRPAFWILLGLVSLGTPPRAVHYFPQAFSIVALDITMTRERALADARTIVTRDQFGPAGLSAGGVVRTRQRDADLHRTGRRRQGRVHAHAARRLYSAYTWRVRHFREGETNETTVRFTPDGQPYGFVEKFEGRRARRRTRRRRGAATRGTDARARWNVDLTPFTPRRTGTGTAAGRPHRSHAHLRTLAAGPRRRPLPTPPGGLRRSAHRSHPLRQIPEAFTRRYDSMRSANEAIGIGSLVGMVLLYVVGGIGVGLFFMLRSRYVLWRQAAIWGVSSARCRRWRPQRVAADLDELRHGRPAQTFLRRADCIARRRRCSASRRSWRCPSWRPRR